MASPRTTPVCGVATAQPLSSLIFLFSKGLWHTPTWCPQRGVQVGVRGCVWPCLPPEHYWYARGYALGRNPCSTLPSTPPPFHPSIAFQTINFSAEPAARRSTRPAGLLLPSCPCRKAPVLDGGHGARHARRGRGVRAHVQPRAERCAQVRVWWVCLCVCMECVLMLNRAQSDVLRCGCGGCVCVCAWSARSCSTAAFTHLVGVRRQLGWAKGGGERCTQHQRGRR